MDALTDYEDEFENLGAGDLFQELRLRNNDEVVQQIKEFDGDFDRLTRLISDYTASDDWPDNLDPDEVDEGSWEYLADRFGRKLATTILGGSPLPDFTGLDEVRAEDEGKKITTEASIHAVKELPNTHTVHWKCNECGSLIDTRSELPYKQPGKPASCDACGKSAKKYFSFEGSERTHGFQFRVTKPNKMPSQDSRLVSVWVPLDEFDLGDDIEDEEKIGAILEGYGSEIEITGDIHFKIDTSRGEVKNSELWIIADRIKKSESELERVDLTADDREKIRDEFERYDDERDLFDDYIAPEFIGRSKLKRAMAYTMATPLEIKKRDGEILDYGVGRLMLVGDPGTAKSKTTQAFLKTSLEPLGAEKITAEYLSIAGLGGTVTKSNDGFWEIDWGILPYVHESALVLDGMHQFSKKWLSKLREIIEEKVIKIVKAAKGETDCAARIIGIANTNLYPINEHYPTNYQASFDIGIGSEDDTNKLSGADRRRWDLIWVLNDDDVQKSDIDSHILEDLSTESDDVDQLLWNKLWAWIWNLRYEDYDWDKIGNGLKDDIVAMLNEWRNAYPHADLAVLGNKGSRIVSSYLMASAALHCRVNEDGKVSPTKADLENVRSLFEDMFENLELEKWERTQAQKETIAQSIHDAIQKGIAENPSDDPREKDRREQYEDLKSIIEIMGEDPTQSMESIAQQVGVVRKTVYNRLNMELTLDLPNHTIDTYTPMDGYRDGIIDISPLTKSGRLTSLGKEVLREIRREDSDTSDVDSTGDDGDGEGGGESSRSRSSGDVEIDEELEGYDPEDPVGVAFVADQEEFMGVDMEEYGSFEEGDVAAIPADNAEVVVEQGTARMLTPRDKAEVQQLIKNYGRDGVEKSTLAGVLPFDDEVAEEMMASLKKQGDAYEPRSGVIAPL